MSELSSWPLFYCVHPTTGKLILVTANREIFVSIWSTTDINKNEQRAEEFNNALNLSEDDIEKYVAELRCRLC